MGNLELKVEKKIEETNAIKLKEIEEKVKMSKNHV